MNYAPLTARYRPQNFSELAGQSTLKSILSRAALEDKVAPAYLFSGTRGVGKTTIARVFAKALNCRKAPTAEPCNECDQCRAITAGSSIDVVEVDGASNRGIDDVRKLKESVGYSPMEGRYKIFIIDEAHMLSREAFNALLKTLEEPPARVTFILATTEPHKFPVTIVSRCQHYVFKSLSDLELEEHLTKVLNKENMNFEHSAVRLIVRRAAGSVRDAMSLLGQVLAMGDATLTEDTARMVLGLAGQELFFRIITAIKNSDCLALTNEINELLSQGLDLSFFLRELTGIWRNLFMLKQVGESATSVTGLTPQEAMRWLKEAQDFKLSHIHACWQMTLEGQRRVLTSLEPAMALELLLTNIAMLPKLLSLDQLSTLSRRLPSDKDEEKKKLDVDKATFVDNAAFNDKVAIEPQSKSIQSDTSFNPVVQASPPWESVTEQAEALDSSQLKSAEPKGHQDKKIQSDNVQGNAIGTVNNSSIKNIENENLSSDPTSDKISPVAEKSTHRSGLDTTENKQVSGLDKINSHTSKIDAVASEQVNNLDKKTILSNDVSVSSNACEMDPEPEDEEDEVTLGVTGQKIPTFDKWADFLSFLTTQPNHSPSLRPLLLKATSIWSDDALKITVKDQFTATRLSHPDVNSELLKSIEDFSGTKPEITIQVQVEEKQDKSKIEAEVKELPVVKALIEKMGATLEDFGPWYKK